MSTRWVVTAATERVTLDGQRKGEIAFTVTNPTNASDRAVFDVVPGDGAEPGWFSVEDPQRLVRGGASVAYLMKVAVPATTAPGTYPLQGLVYSADSAPEESSVLSPRVALTVASEPEPVAKQKWPWWWLLVAAGLVAVVLIVVGVLVFGGGEEPSRPPGAGEVAMPDLEGMSEREALNTLSELGLAVRPIAYRHDPERADTVVRQSLPAGEPVSVDAVVNLEVAVELTAPLATAPTGVSFVPAGEPMPTLEWDPGDSPVRAWRVTFFLEVCNLDFAKVDSSLIYQYCSFPDRMSIDPDGPGNNVIGFEPESQIIVDLEETRYTPAPTLQPMAVPVGRRYHTGWVGWQVQALDDFDNPGPASELMVFRVGTHQP